MRLLRKEDEIAKWRRLVTLALLFTVPVFLISMVFRNIPPVKEAVLDVIVVGHLTVEGLVLLLLCTPVQFWVGRGLYVSSFAALSHRTANMDVLVCLGVTAAYGYSIIPLVVGSDDFFFE